MVEVLCVEDIDRLPPEKEAVTTMIPLLFRGVFNEVIAYDEDGNEWMIPHH